MPTPFPHPPCCLSPPAAATAPAVPVRLVGGRTNREGRVEVFTNGIWGRVSDLSGDAATVVCKQAGLGSTGFTNNQPLFAPAGSGAVWVRSPQCLPTTAGLLSCTYTADDTYDGDSGYTDAHISCQASGGEGGRGSRQQHWAGRKRGQLVGPAGLRSAGAAASNRAAGSRRCEEGRAAC